LVKNQKLTHNKLHAAEYLAPGTLHAAEDTAASTPNDVPDKQIDVKDVKKVFFSTKAFEMMKESLGREIPENGGALFGKEETLRSPYPFITEFVLDNQAKTTHATYTINTDYLNPAIHVLWDNFSLEMQGLVHSHPRGFNRPSVEDMRYFRSMFTKMKRPFVITPIIHSEAEGSFQFFCYLVGPDEKEPALWVEYAVVDNEEDYEKEVAKLENIDTDALNNDNAIDSGALKAAEDLDPDTLHANKDL